VRIGKFATLSPGVVVSGNVDVGEGAYLGTGCIIREKVQIGAWSEVGGGAFVAKPVFNRTLVVGVPAVFKKDL
jgi:serine acetyltransferase